MENNQTKLSPGWVTATTDLADNGPELYELIFRDLGEEELTTDELVELMNKPYKWCCQEKDCRQYIRFTLDQLDAIPFVIVRHLEKGHGMTREQIEQAQPALKKEIVHERWALSEPTPDTP